MDFLKALPGPLNAAYHDSRVSRPASSERLSVPTGVMLEADRQVVISVEARAFAQVTDYYAQFFPSRSDLNVDALALTVALPGATSSSTGLNFSEVAHDARARLDARYAVIEASDQPFDRNAWGGRDSNSLFGDLDRRSLFAVKSNEGGLFSVQEQNYAQSLMLQQIALASGFYSGPSDRQGAFIDPHYSTEEHLQARMAFLDNVSPEEKRSTDWLVWGGAFIRNDGRNREADDIVTVMNKLLDLAQPVLSKSEQHLQAIASLAKVIRK